MELLTGVALLSVLTLVLYGVDKLRAKRSAWRIPEKILLGCGLLGGAPGALLGMLLFRHKTKHWYFWTVNALSCVVWLSLLLKTMINGIN